LASPSATSRRFVRRSVPEKSIATLAVREVPGVHEFASGTTAPADGEKPIAITLDGKAATIETSGRHDPCVGIRATPIAEAMLACVLMDHALRHRAQCGDVTPPTRLG